MIDINRHNYEEFFIDYIDGNLNHIEVAELMIFLSENPDLDAELNEMKEFGIVEKPIKFPNKTKLKKDINSLSGNLIDDKCIAKLEGDLNKKELQDFNSEIENNLSLQFNYFNIEKTKLKKDTSIVYNNKQDLKQSVKTISISPMYRYAAILIPAIIISVLYLSSVNNTIEPNKHSFMANNKQDKLIISKKENTENPTNEFKIIKKETPSIVSKSVNLVENKHEKELVSNKNSNINKNTSTTVFIDPVNRFIDERKKLANLSFEDEDNTEQKDEVSGTYFKTYDFASNEIKSDDYIRQQMEQFKANPHSKTNENSSFGESIAESFSNISSVFQFEKEKVDDGKVYRLAFNSRKFEIGRKIKKKED